MARIKQVGIGRMASGTIDGITYVTRSGPWPDNLTLNAVKGKGTIVIAGI